MTSWLWSLPPALITLPFVLLLVREALKPDFDWGLHFVGPLILLAIPGVMWVLILYGRWTA